MESVRAILEAVFGSLLYELLLASLVAAILAYLRAKRDTWAPPALFAVYGFVAVLVISYVFVGRGLLSKEQPQTTPGNIETNIKAWADKFALGIQKGTDDKYSFAYAISLPSGRVALVGRPKDREGYLQFQGNMALAAEHELALKKLTPAQQERIADEINLEMARNKIGFAFVGLPFKGLVVTKAVPITNNLTEDSFISDLDEIDSSMLLAREAIRLAFFRNGVPDVMPRLVPPQ